jgi:hypothetical protein
MTHSELRLHRLRPEAYERCFFDEDGDAVARHAWLAHFKYRITNAVSIFNADLVIRKSLDGEPFSELAVDEVITSEKAFPIVIGVHLIDKDGSLLPHDRRDRLARRQQY